MFTAVRAHGLVGLTMLAVVASATPATAAAGTKPAAASADRALIAAAQKVDACLAAHRSCGAQLAKLQTAAGRAEARAAGLTRKGGKLAAPALSASGQRLSWRGVSGVPSYLLKASLKGRADQYSVVRGTVTVPSGTPGRTVAYRVRTVVVGSAWSSARSITFSDATAGAIDQTAAAPAVSGSSAAPAPVTRPGTPSAPATPKPTTPAAPTAPATTTGATTPAPTTTTVDTTPLPTTTTTTTTPAPTTTTTTTTTPAPTTPTTTTPAPAPAPTAARVGLNVSGSDMVPQLTAVKALGARSVRAGFDISTPVSQITPVVKAYADAGVQVDLLADFSGRIPTSSETAALATWAAAFGPGGSFWKGTSYASSLAVDRIEFGNESSGSWQYPSLAGNADATHSATYAAIAEGYGRAFRDASVAMKAANQGVRLLAVADEAGRWSQWVDGMFRAVPDLGSYVGGWVVHPYGPDWAMNVDDALQQVRNHGASDSIPVYATETGVATDDGRCLSDNYGWDPCMTYAKAGQTLTDSVDAMFARYGSRLKAVDLYTAKDRNQPATSNEREAYFGAMTPSYTAKGGFTSAIKGLLAQ